MKSLLFLINLALTVAAVWLTQRVVQPPAVTAPSTVEDDAEVVAPVTAVAKRPAPPALRDADAEQIWQHTLFHPERTFEIEPEEAAAVPEPKTQEQFAEQYELRSTSKLGERSCANIAVRSNRPSATSSRPRRAPLSSRTSRQPVAAKKQESSVYRLNEAVGETGYILAVVDYDSVTLRNPQGDEIVLHVDKTDDDSAARRQSAVKEAELERRREEAAERRSAIAASLNRRATTNAAGANAALPPPPPPPPPVTLPAGIGATPGAPPAGDVQESSAADAEQRRRTVQKQYIRAATTRAPQSSNDAN